MLFGNARSTADKLKALGEAYSAALPGKLQELESAAAALSGGGTFEQLSGPLNEVRALAHKIAGTAGTFGFQAITDQAREVEKTLLEAIEAKAPLTAEQAAVIESEIAALRALGTAAAGTVEQAEPAPVEAAQAESIVLLAPPGEATETLTRQIERRGYRVRGVADTASADNGAGDARARAILVHGAVPQGHKICRKLAEEFRQTFRLDLPIIFLSESDDFESRLQAVRAGAAAFVAPPLDADAIVRNIEDLLGSTVFTPHRVLIVEDDDLLAQQCAEAFEGSGYAARIVKDPADLLDRLETFETELIVMDLSLAGVSGIDLAKVVWQHDRYRDLAILFLSPGPEFNMRLLRLGVSDEFFVPRPVDINALRAVAARYLTDARRRRRGANRADLFPHLDRIAELKSSGDKPRPRRDARSSAATHPEGMPVTPPKVLVVDDDRHLVDAIAIKLSEHGLQPLKAFTGEQGFRVAWEESPDAIITDYDMPGGSGDYLLSRLKDAEETRGIPVMVLTAHTVDGQKDYALEREFVGRLGAVCYLAKPISFDVLIDEVGRLIRPPAGDAR